MSSQSKSFELEKTISEYLDNEYAAYGMYTIENRAIPSVIDGFKPTQRKIIFVANRIWKSGNDKPLKVFQFGGKVASDSMYAHGDVSLNSAIIGMAQSFKNSMPLLDSIGQFGSLRAPEAGAPRYISTKLNGNFRLIYKDFELLEEQFEEGFEIEPKYFLPIIPTVLLNGSSGIAVGFATNILNRNPIDLIEACLRFLEKKAFKEPLPWWNNFSGNVEKVENVDSSTFQLRGIIEVVNTTTVIIKELPPSMTYQKFEEILNSLQDKGIIQYYDDNCTKDEINYVIKMSRAELSSRISKNNLLQTFKLIENETENLTCLDENGKLIIFKSASDLIAYFVNFRLSFYEKRKKFLIDELNRQLFKLTNRAEFIKSIVEGKLKVNNRPKEEIIQDLIQKKLEKIDDSFDYLLTMPIYSLTKEKYEELLKQISECLSKKAIIESKQPIDVYKEDLKTLKKSLSELKIF